MATGKIPVEMMSNSTLPLGFFHYHKLAVMASLFLYPPILRQCKFHGVFYSCGSDEIDVRNQLPAYLHLVVWMNNKL